ncbi:copia protein [Tanacetum coccineum]
MLADSKLPTTFWAEAVNTACYVQNRVLIVKPHNKTPYELFKDRTPALIFMIPFRCHVTILNTLDHLGNFDGKSDDGFFVGYSLTSNGPKWLFDIDSLSKSMNYVPVIAGTNSNDFAGLEVSIGEGTTSKETDTSQDYIVMPMWKDSSLFDSPSMNVSHDEPEPSCDAEKKDDEGVSKASGVDDQERLESSTSNINTAGPRINTAGINLKTGSLHINTVSPTVLTTRSNRPQTVSNIFSLRDSVTPEATNVNLFGDEIEMDMSKLNASYQTRGMTKTANEQGFLSATYERKPYENLNTCLFFCFLSEEEPKRVTKALSDLAWVEAMQEELLQNKKDERGIVIRNKAMLVAQGYTQEEGIDYDKVFSHVARIEAIRLFLAYASFMGFMVYQMDMKSAFLYGQIEEEVYVCQSLGFEDPDYPDKVYKMSSIGELTFFLGLQVKQKEDGIFISQDKYVTNILKKFGFQDVRTASTPMDTEKPLLKDSDGDDVDVHLYRSMIGSLMYLTSSRPDIMFAYPRNSPFDLVAYSDSDYAGASLDRKSTTGGCQFLGCRLISWQCKKQTVVATSSTKAEYVAAASCCGQAKHIEYMKCVESQTPRQAKRGLDTKIPQSSGPPKKVGDEAVHKELGNRMERVTTTASSLEAKLTVVTSIGPNPLQHLMSQVLRELVQYCGARSKNTVSPKVKTTAESLVYIRRSAAKRKDKGKDIMKEAEPVQKKTKLQLEQERLRLEEALRLQEQLDEEERQRISRVHEEASTFNDEEWDNIQDQIEADKELAHGLQAQERERYSEADKARLLVELINERKRKFAQQRAEQRRNKPMTQAQQRTYMCNYIKHMGSHTLSQMKKHSFEEIKELFEITMKRVNTFTSMESDDTAPKVVAGSSKRDAKQELNQESSKRQKIGEGSELAKELKDELLKNVLEDHQSRKLHREPTKDKERELWVELKRLFEIDENDTLWKLQRYMHDPLTWKLYDTCGVHHVSTERGCDIFMMVEKDYPLIRALMTLMLCNKLRVDKYTDMANELLKKIFILATRPRHYEINQAVSIRKIMVGYGVCKSPKDHDGNKIQSPVADA